MDAQDPATPKRRAVSKGERARYRARLPNDAEWGRPTEATARKICALLGVDPKSLLAPRDRDGDHVAAQAFTLAIDWVIRLGDRGEFNPDSGELEPGARLTFSGLVYTLAPYWSLRYRAAQSRGATI